MKEITNIKDEISVYYDVLKDNQKKTIQKLEKFMPYYRFTFEKKVKNKEIIYDSATNLFASAGLVISKIFDEGKYYFVISKVSYLPKKFKKPSVVLFKAECSAQDVPNMYPIKLAGVITNSCPSIFTVDLVEIIKTVSPKMEITVVGDKYEIASGTGYKAELIFENVKYKDLKKNQSFKHKNAVFNLSADERDEKSNDEITDAVLRHCKELFRYEETRFEIARRVLKARSEGKKVKFDKNAYLEAQKKKAQQDKENAGL